MNLFGTRIPAIVLALIGVILGYFLAHKGFVVPMPAPVAA